MTTADARRKYLLVQLLDYWGIMGGAIDAWCTARAMHSQGIVGNFKRR
jgi:hypothetical protein